MHVRDDVIAISTTTIGYGYIIFTSPFSLNLPTYSIFDLHLPHTLLEEEDTFKNISQIAIA
jgi:hypothetical protein